MEHDVEILLVEDNPNDAELALDALRQAQLANYIQVVRDGAEAIDFIFRQGSTPIARTTFPDSSCLI